eukprot:9499263-Pyramimonas_sp.AAC.1
MPRVWGIVRRIVDRYLTRVCAHKTYLLSFLRAKTRVLASKLEKVSDRITQQYAASALFSLNMFHEICQHPTYAPLLCYDVFWCDHYWDVPVDTAPARLWQQMEGQLRQHHWLYMFSRRPPCFASLGLRFWRAFLEVCPSHSLRVSPPLVSLRDTLVQELGHVVWVGVDKDPHRRVGVPWYQYLWHLGKIFLEDPAHYQHMPDLTRKSVAKRQRRLDKKYIPRRWRNPVPAQPEHIARAYITYK